MPCGCEIVYRKGEVERWNSVFVRHDRSLLLPPAVVNKRACDQQFSQNAVHVGVSLSIVAIHC
jgi:hypothetical protein